MITESIAILAISLCLMFIYVRAKRADYAISLLPLLTVPALHLLFYPVLKSAQIWLPCSYRLALSFVDITALAASCLLVALFSAKVKSKKNKKLYVLLLGSYNVVLACAYVYNMMAPLLNFRK